MNIDQLVQCLEEMLKTVRGDEDPEIFIDRVAEEYLMVLVRKAHIPLRYLASLREDVRTEVHDLLRVRAYAYPSIKDFFMNQASQGRRAL